MIRNNIDGTKLEKKGRACSEGVEKDPPIGYVIREAVVTEKGEQLPQVITRKIIASKNVSKGSPISSCILCFISTQGNVKKFIITIPIGSNPIIV